MENNDLSWAKNEKGQLATKLCYCHKSPWFIFDVLALAKSVQI